MTFRVFDTRRIFYWLLFLLLMGLKQDLTSSTSNLLFALILFFFVPIVVFLRFVTKIKVKKMGIDKHLFLDNREWESAVSITEFFNERRNWLLKQYKNNKIDPEVLKELYLRKETRWKSL